MEDGAAKALGAVLAASIVMLDWGIGIRNGRIQMVDVSIQRIGNGRAVDIGKTTGTGTAAGIVMVAGTGTGADSVAHRNRGRDLSRTGHHRARMAWVRKQPRQQWNVGTR